MLTTGRVSVASPTSPGWFVPHAPLVSELRSIPPMSVVPTKRAIIIITVRFEPDPLAVPPAWLQPVRRFGGPLASSWR